VRERGGNTSCASSDNTYKTKEKVGKKRFSTGENRRGRKKEDLRKRTPPTLADGRPTPNYEKISATWGWDKGKG